MKIALSLLVGVALGFSACFVLFGRTTTRDHWKVVERYNAFLEDPANYKPDAATGLAVATPPGDPLPDLDALVASGELTHVDLVFPTVPNSHAASQHWLKFCEAHKEIVFVTGNPSYPSFTPTGTQPLHLNIWFRDTNAAIVQTLMRELESTYANKQANTH